MIGLIPKIGPWTLITALHYAYPGLALLYFVIASTVAVCTLQTLSPKVKAQRARRDVILWLMGGVICQYIIHASLLLVRSIVQKDWVAPPDEVVYLISSALVWGLQFVSLLDSQSPVWYPYHGNWFAAIVFETALLVGPSVLHKPVDAYDFISLSFSSLRVCSFMVLPAVYFATRIHKETCESDDAESQPLLTSGLASGAVSSEELGQNGNDYGATDDSSDEGTKKITGEEEENDDFWFKRQRENEEKVTRRLKADGNWWIYLKGFRVFLPYLWPFHSKTLQFRALLTGLCLLLENFLNILVPRQLGQVTDALIAGNGARAWIAVGIYSVLSFANSSACIGWLQFWLWQPIEQYSYDALTSAVHSHVMSLSSEFHESRTSSDIHQTINQGRAITNIVDTVCFKVGPTLVDLFLVSAYLLYLFGPYMALDIVVTTFFYLYTTAKLVSLSQKRRRTYHIFWRKEWSSLVSSINNWRVASYFNQIPYEKSQHQSNIKAQLQSQRAYNTLFNIIKVSQTLVMTLGLLGACFLAVYQVINKLRSPGDFVILLSYWAQLRGPLAIFSSLYKDLSENLMDAERMLELFKIKPKIINKKDAKPLKLIKGDIKFKDVTFAYDDRKPALSGINLRIEGGTTVAIVGETGSGKSTTLKLLQRFYDVTGGSIQIDGQDIRDITVESLRENIAVVPQDATLFSETIMTNLRYAKLDATKKEVYDACKAAKIHDKIMSIPDKYKYKIGNTAIKLSGGEQQRLSIARAILKQSAIILLDEATSAVDTETELQIQEALNKLCQGHTTVIVAHRLSTIMRADRIIVMQDGRIIEHGSHDNLLRLKGKYFDLWAHQIQLISPDDTTNNKPDDVNPHNRVERSRSHSTHKAKDKANVGSWRSRSKSPQKDEARREYSGSNSLRKDDNSIKSSRSRSNSPQKDNAGIVNDLDPEQNQVELLRLAELSKIDAEGSQNVDCKIKTTRLKADAPEFYPHQLRSGTEGTDNSAATESKKQAKDRLRLEKDHKKQEEKTRRSQDSLAKKAAKNAGKQPGQLSDIEEPPDDARQSSSSPTMESSQDSAASGKGNKNEGPKLRRPRFSSRRHLSKSEPAGQDGTNDSEEITGDSGESQPLLGSGHMQNRRVSAPSDPASSQQESRSSSLGIRSRRSRHWRIRKGYGTTSGSASTLATASSMDSSMDEAAPPNRSITSPAGGVESASVTFAPDAK